MSKRGEHGALRAADAAALDALYDAMVQSGRGRTIFVAGDDAIGRDELLQVWAAGLSAYRPRPTVLGGRLDGERYEPWGVDAQAAAEHRAAVDGALSVAKAVPLATLGLPPAIEQLLSHLLSASKDLLRFATDFIGIRGRRAASDVLPEVIRELCRKGPAVYIIDSVDERAGELWSELAGLLAHQIASDLPLLLVLGLDGPRDVGEPRGDEPEHLAVARDLTTELADLATWHWLAPMTAENVQRWTGPLAPDVASWLLELTNGCSGEMALHWAQWQDDRLIERHTDGRWRFSSYDPSLDIDGRLNGRLRELTGGGYVEITATEKLLACAALEGRRFTADAVAIALDRDPDATAEFIDNSLVRLDARPNGLLTAQPSPTIRASGRPGNVAVYRFARELDWLVMRRIGFSAGDRRHYAVRLAKALEDLYGDQAPTRADTLARLYELAGDTSHARKYQRLAGLGRHSRTTLWRARNALRAPEPLSVLARGRMAQRLITGAEELLNRGPFEDGAEFARAAERLAQTGRQRAYAAYLLAGHLYSLGEIDKARAEYGRARELYYVVGGDTGRGGAAVTLAGAATCDRMQGRMEDARAGYSAALEIYRGLGHRGGEASVRQGIAICDREQGRMEDARAGFSAALVIYRELGQGSGEAGVRHGIAECDRLQGRMEAARAGYSAALEMYRELGQRSGEASVRYVIAGCDRVQGRMEDARAGFSAALEICRDLGQRSGEADARHGIAGCDLGQGRMEDARAGFSAALEIYRDLGWRSREANVYDWLANIDRGQGRMENARAGYSAGLEIYRELGQRSGEASVRHGIAACDRLQGRMEDARAGYSAALEIYRELGDRGGEAGVRHGIARCDRVQGRMENARAGYSAALEIYRELGQRSGEADVRGGIAGCDRVQGRMEAARAGYSAALEIYRELGERSGEADVRGGIAGCDRVQGRMENARAGYSAALEIYRELGERSGEASILDGIAICDREQGRMKNARAGFSAALEIYRELGERSGEASILDGIAICDREQGRMKNARAGFSAALEIYRELGERSGEASILDGIAICDREQGRIEDARAGFSAALEIYRELGVVERAAAVETKLADLSHAAGA